MNYSNMIGQVKAKRDLRKEAFLPVQDFSVLLGHFNYVADLGVY